MADKDTKKEEDRFLLILYPIPINPIFNCFHIW